jgi:hypothetical protein
MMGDRIRSFLEYLLDTETTSEVVFYEKLHENKELFETRFRSAYESTINVKFDQWKDLDLKERSIVESGPTTTLDDDDDDSSSDQEEDDSIFDDDEREQTVPVGRPQKRQVSSETSTHGS